METEHSKKIPSVPSNFLTLSQLKERWLQKKQKEKEEEEEKARLQRQREEEEEEEERNCRREKEEQQRKTQIQHTLKRQNTYGVRPRSNNFPSPPFHRNRRNQCPGDGEKKPAKTHVAEVSSYVKRRNGWKNREPIDRNRQNQCPGVVAGDDKLKPEETQIGESVAEGSNPKNTHVVEVSSETEWKNREPIDRNRRNQCSGGIAGDGKLTPEETHIGESVAEVTETKNTHIAEVFSNVRRRNGWRNREPIDRNRRNQCPGVVAGDGELKPEETQIVESVAEVAEPKIDGSLKRIGLEKGKSFHRSRRNQSPVGGSGDTVRKTHIAEVVHEDVGLKIDDAIKRAGSERRGNPRAQKEDRNGGLLPEKGAEKEIKVGGKGRIEEKKAWADGSRQLERKIEKISLCGGGGGGEGFSGRPSGYVHGGSHHRKFDKDSSGFDWRKRNSNLVWVKKEG